MLSPRFIAACFAALLTVVSGASNATTPTYKNPKASIDDRVADLLSRMTIQDKMAQLMQGDVTNWMNQTNNDFNFTGLVANMETKAGSFYVGYAVPQDWILENVKKGQDYLLQNTTLGIPALVQSEGIHGFLIGNATVFNSPIGFASSFNTELVEKMATIIGQEAIALGVNQLFAPVVDLARELRFGRVEETYGEDSYLAGEMGFSFVKGLQSQGVSAMVKHFAGFSAPEQGANTGPVHGGEREFRTTWAPSFKRAIIDGGAFGIMAAYHCYDGVPAVADYHHLTEILRNEWGYQYFVMSDAGGTDRLCKAFQLCQTDPIDSDTITLLALNAGTDAEMGGGSFNYRQIPDLVASGKLDIKTVDTAVSRFLRSKFELGLFENPYPTKNLSAQIHTPEAVALARQLDAESIVLLENHNNVLPLSKTANIAVIGPMASFINFGDYVVHLAQFNEHNVNPLQGIQAASQGKVTFAQGCERWSSDQSGFSEAVATAEAADVAVVFVGTWSRDQFELWNNFNATTGEHIDTADLGLVGAMGPLVKAIINTGKPTVVVYSSGKPITEPWISNSSSALIQQFYPSEQGGNAIADVLFGDHNPSGKLSVSFPFDVGTLPTFYDYLNSARQFPAPGHVYENGTLVFGSLYTLNDPRPMYEFGYGKSYTTFSYSDLKLSKTQVSATDSITATVTVTNTGKFDGQEVVQLYAKDVFATVTVPNIKLKGFKKVMIQAGQSVDVEIPLDIADLWLWNLQGQYVVEPGDFVLSVGSSSLDLRSNATLTVV